jgi:hypothetical protein
MKAEKVDRIMATRIISKSKSRSENPKKYSRVRHLSQNLTKFSDCILMMAMARGSGQIYSSVYIFITPLNMCSLIRAPSLFLSIAESQMKYLKALTQ